MPFFRKKAACASCGTQVKEPRSPEEFLCPECGRPGPWASDEQCITWEKRAAALEGYRASLAAMVLADGVSTVTPELAQLQMEAGLSPEVATAERATVFRRYVEGAIADEILTPEETARYESLANAWEIKQAMIDDELSVRLAVASINGGVLPEVSEPRLLPKPGEIVHAEWAASLMKEVAVREYQGGTHGFSIPIGGGVRYRVAGTRGRSVQVGTQLQVADSGILSVTNRRVVYTGSRKTVDMPYPKMISITPYTDGIQFHLSNRVNAPLFTIPANAQILGAIVNVAAQKAAS